MESKEYMALFYDRVVRASGTIEAYLLDFGGNEKWIPKSLIHPDDLPLEEEGGEINVQLWFVEQEGLENYENV